MRVFRGAQELCEETRMRTALDHGNSDVLALELRDNGCLLSQVSQRLQPTGRRCRRRHEPRATLKAPQRRLQRIQALALGVGPGFGSHRSRSRQPEPPPRSSPAARSPPSRVAPPAVSRRAGSTAQHRRQSIRRAGRRGRGGQAPRSAGASATSIAPDASTPSFDRRSFGPSASLLERPVRPP